MKSYHNSHLSYIDLLLNVCMIFAALFMIAIVLMNDPAQKDQKKVDEKAKILITMTWDDQSADDMDLWLLTPEPASIGFRNPNGNIADLTRDDLGVENDVYQDAAGVNHITRLNKEVIAIRTAMDGHYTVNGYFYSRHEDPESRLTSEGPENVVIQVIQIDPAYKELVTQTVSLDTTVDGRERTAVSFDIDNGAVVGIDTETQQMFVGQIEGAETGQ